MKKYLFIAVLIVILLTFVLASCQDKEDKIEQEIMEKACIELEIEDVEYTQISFVKKEECGYLKYDCYTYIVNINGRRYYVQALRNEKELHFVDVIGVV